MTALPDAIRDGQALATRLVVPPARLGWEYVEVPEQRGFDQPEPVLRLPEPPSFRHLEGRDTFGFVLAALGLVSVLLGLGFLLQGGISSLILVGGGAVLFAPYVAVRAERARLVREGDARVRQRETAHEQRLAEWLTARAAHDRAEQERVASAPRWFPLAADATSRIDVVGGNRQGQEVFLAVLGCSLIADGGHLLVVDLTGGRLGGTLTEVMTAAGRPFTTVDLACDRVDLLAGVPEFEVAEAVASAMHPPSRDADRRDRRDRVAALVSTAVRALEGKVTTGRLVDALLVLNRTYRNGVLEPFEVERLADLAHDVVQGERTAEELRSVLARWEPIAERSGERALALHGTESLTLVTVPGPHTRHGAALAELLLARLCSTGAEQCPGQSYTAVVAGADQLTKPVIDELGRRFEDKGARLVLVFDELRDESLALFGGQGATTVVMQLGQHDQAEAAAKSIGRGHQFVLSQVSRQEGQTATKGGGHSTATTDGESHTRGYSTGQTRQGLHFGSNSSDQESFTVQHSTTRTENSSWSIAESVTDGQVVARSYDFTIEPTQIQSLDTFAFVLVDRHGGDRRIRVGNADPRIAALPLVADAPR